MTVKQVVYMAERARLTAGEKFQNTRSSKEE